MSDLHISVEINSVQIIKQSYALYRIDLSLTREGSKTSTYQAFRRFSEFVKLKQNLEQEMGSELPYELPPRQFNRWLKPSGSCDPDVIEKRKKELSNFLHDLLNDSFDTRWKRSPYVCHFLQIPSNWEELNFRTRTQSRDPLADFSEEGLERLADAQKWLEELRNCKIIFAEASRDPTSWNKVSVQLRLRTQNLEKFLKIIEAEQLVGASEIQRRRNLLGGLKNELNERVMAARSGAFQVVDQDNQELFSGAEPEQQKPLAGRKIGETNQTLKLNNQELLQLHKDTTQSQDLELEQLRKIILNQKELSLTMNQELTQQNELLDLMSGEVDSTANKLRMANRNAKRINEG
ncbi:LANO_0D01662g1_1 [Lachancea nothofagi CBS 11611]|uniref:LANO_0D01662g1_1 n=1 Tax=Lachancea nothofagi CBS 11611 TaxID=1266666 RepID=A0A1G4JDP5_9SACH|nr:LANO_0D01662g1_1 [Lachancea nothofagi CBS 11611]